MEDITDVLYDEKGNILVDKNGKELQGISYIEQENNYITDMIQGLENTKELNITDVQQLVKDEYIIPITKMQIMQSRFLFKETKRKKFHFII